MRLEIDISFVWYSRRKPPGRIVKRTTSEVLQAGFSVVVPYARIPNLRGSRAGGYTRGVNPRKRATTSETWADALLLTCRQHGISATLLESLNTDVLFR